MGGLLKNGGFSGKMFSIVMSFLVYKVSRFCEVCQKMGRKIGNLVGFFGMIYSVWKDLQTSLLYAFSEKKFVRKYVSVPGLQSWP